MALVVFLLSVGLAAAAGACNLTALAAVNEQTIITNCGSTLFSSGAPCTPQCAQQFNTLVACSNEDQVKNNPQFVQSYAMASAVLGPKCGSGATSAASAASTATAAPATSADTAAICKSSSRYLSTGVGQAYDCQQSTTVYLSSLPQDQCYPYLMQNRCVDNKYELKTCRIIESSCYCASGANTVCSATASAASPQAVVLNSPMMTFPSSSATPVSVGLGTPLIGRTSYPLTTSGMSLSGQFLTGNSISSIPSLATAGTLSGALYQQAPAQFPTSQTSQFGQGFQAIPSQSTLLSSSTLLPSSSFSSNLYSASTLPAPKYSSTLPTSTYTSVYPATTYGYSASPLPSTTYSASTLPNTYSASTFPTTTYSTSTLPTTLSTFPNTYSASTLPTATYSASTLPTSMYSASTLPTSMYSASTFPNTLYSANTLPSTTYSASTLPATFSASTLPATFSASTLPATYSANTLSANSLFSSIPASTGLSSNFYSSALSPSTIRPANTYFMPQTTFSAQSTLPYGSVVQPPISGYAFSR